MIPNFSWSYDEEEDVRQRRQCAQLLGIAAETAEGTLAPIVGSMYVRAHFDSDIWLEAQESKDLMMLLSMVIAFEYPSVIYLVTLRDLSKS